MAAAKSARDRAPCPGVHVRDESERVADLLPGPQWRPRAFSMESAMSIAASNSFEANASRRSGLACRQRKRGRVEVPEELVVLGVAGVDRVGVGVRPVDPFDDGGSGRRARGGEPALEVRAVVDAVGPHDEKREGARVLRLVSLEESVAVGVVENHREAVRARVVDRGHLRREVGLPSSICWSVATMVPEGSSP